MPKKEKNSYFKAEMEALSRNFSLPKNIIELQDQILEIAVINRIPCAIHLLNDSSFRFRTE